MLHFKSTPAPPLSLSPFLYLSPTRPLALLHSLFHSLSLSLALKPTLHPKKAAVSHLSEIIQIALRAALPLFSMLSQCCTQ